MCQTTHFVRIVLLRSRRYSQGPHLIGMSYFSTENIMTKRRRSKQSRGPAPNKLRKEVKRWLPWQQHLAAIVGLVVIITVLYNKSIIYSMIYPTGDTIAELVNNHQMLQYMVTTGEIAQWNPFPWGGMPNIFYLPRSFIAPDFYLHLLADWLTFPLVFTLVGALGMYFLLRYLRLDTLLAFFGAAVFVLLPYQKSLIMVGHFFKYEAVMYIPWVILGLKVLLDKPRWIYGLGLAFALAFQLRAGHYQVTFYTGVLMALVITVDLWHHRMSGRMTMIKKFGAAVLAGLFAACLAAQPLLLASKFAGQSVRGGHIERLDQPGEAAHADVGVAKDFVAQWSFAPTELLSLVIPNAVGGTSETRLSASDAQRLNQNIVSTYWGHAPFNSSFYYLGIIPLLLVVLGFMAKSHKVLPSMWLAVLLMLVWMLGTFAEPFYSLCYTLVPFFKNFRTPTTSIVVVNFALSLLAALGAQAIKALPKKNHTMQGKRLKKLWWICLGTLCLVLLVSTSFGFEKVGQNMSEEAAGVMREIRQGLFYWDLTRIAIIAAICLGCLQMVYRRKWKAQTVTWIVVIMALADLGFQHTQYGTKPVTEGTFRDKYLAKTSAIDFMMADDDLFRVEPFASSNLGLPYYLQTIGGGFELQMNRYAYEVFYNNLHYKLDGNLQMNWNVLDAMNVKYVVSQRKLTHPNLREEHRDNTGRYVYRYKFNLDRGYFVDKYRVVTDDRERLAMLNDPSLDIRTTALVESEISEKIGAVSRSKVELVSYALDRIVYTVEAEADGLFVLSEIYAPASQKVLIDGQPASQVYKTNHLVQSVVVPKGLHTIELRYQSARYNICAWISKISFGLALLWFVLWFTQRYWSNHTAKMLNN